MNYTLHQLHVFLRVAQTKSVTKAAESLHLTQPAVSIQLKNFQEQFEIPLTEVVGRKLFITDFGKEIAEAAQKIVNEVEAINFKTNAYKGQLTGRLKLSVVSTGKYVIPFFLSDFMKKQEGITLNMKVTNKAGVLESLEKNEVDFSLVSILPEKMNIEKISLMSNKLFLVGNTEETFDKKYYTKSIFEKLPLIHREEGSGTRKTMELYLEKNKVNALKKMELQSNEAVKQAVMAGLGYSIMPLIGIKNELNSKILQVIPVRNLPISSTWYLIWLKNKNFSPAASHFLEYIQLEKERIIKEKFSWYEEFTTDS